MVLVVPLNVKGPVPVLMMFGRPSLPAPAEPSSDDMNLINKAFKETLIKDNPELRRSLNVTLHTNPSNAKILLPQ